MDCCFSSICPNDLINNVGELEINNQTSSYTPGHNQQSMTAYDNGSYGKSVISFGDEYYSTGSSCSSSSSSIESQQFDIKPSIALSLESLGFQQQQCIISVDNKQFSVNELPSQCYYEPEQAAQVQSSIQSFEPRGDFFRMETSVSPSSSLSSSLSSSSSSSSSNELGNSVDSKFRNTRIYQFQQQKAGQSKKMKVTTAEPLQTVASNNPIIIVESSGGGGGGSSKRALTNTPSHSKLNKTNILPPSPPSSFGSDSESNHSSASSHSTGHKLGVSSSKLLGITKAGKHSSLASKTCKLSSSLRNSSTLMKQMRHQPYTGYKATLGSGKSKSVAVKCEETVLNTSGANCLNMSTNSDDDCWPFLCSLSVILNNYLILFEVKFLFCYCF